MTPFRIKIGLTALLIAGASGAFARSDGHEVREAVRDVHQYGRGERNGNPGQFRQFEEPRSTDSGYPDQDNSRRGRMSPEDRRTLRQQINEAGQDIYTRRRR